MTGERAHPSATQQAVRDQMLAHPLHGSGRQRTVGTRHVVAAGEAHQHERGLEAADAGDGITCDMANWAEALLTPATKASKPTPS